MIECGTGRFVIAFVAGMLAAVATAFIGLCLAEYRWYK